MADEPRGPMLDNDALTGPPAEYDGHMPGEPADDPTEIAEHNERTEDAMQWSTIMRNVAARHRRRRS